MLQVEGLFDKGKPKRVSHSRKATQKKPKGCQKFECIETAHEATEGEGEERKRSPQTKSQRGVKSSVFPLTKTRSSRLPR